MSDLEVQAIHTRDAVVDFYPHLVEFERALIWTSIQYARIKCSFLVLQECDFTIGKYVAFISKEGQCYSFPIPKEQLKEGALPAEARYYPELYRFTLYREEVVGGLFKKKRSAKIFQEYIFLEKIGDSERLIMARHPELKAHIDLEMGSEYREYLDAIRSSLDVFTATALL